MFGCIKPQASKFASGHGQSAVGESGTTPETGSTPGERTTLQADSSTPAIALRCVLQTSQAHGFGDLPWHVLHVLMSHVVGHADVDTVRSARLVCRSWRQALRVNITAAMFRPMTKYGLDIDDKHRPIINYRLEGLRAPVRQEYVSMTEAVLESGYLVYVSSPEKKDCNGVSLKEAQEQEDEAAAHWQVLKKSTLFPGSCFRGGPVRANSLGHYPIEASLTGDSEADDASSAGDEIQEEDVRLPGDFHEMIGTVASTAVPVPVAATSTGAQYHSHTRTHSAASPASPTGNSRDDDAHIPATSSWRIARRHRSETLSADLHSASPAVDPRHSSGGRRHRRKAARRTWLPSISRSFRSETLSADVHADEPIAREDIARSTVVLSPSAPATVVLANQELDEYALSLRQQYGYAPRGDEDAELPAVVLRVAAAAPGEAPSASKGSAPAPPASSDGLRREMPAATGGSPPAGSSPGSGGIGKRAFMNFWGRSRSGGISAADEAAGGDGDATSSAELSDHGQQALQSLAGRRAAHIRQAHHAEPSKLALKPESAAGATADGAEASGSACNSAGVGDGDGEISAVMPPAEDIETCSRYPTPRCALLLRPTQAPVTSRERRALISTQHPPLRAALVSLAPLLSMPALQSLSLRQAMYGVDTEALALMTGLTHLSLRLQRRDRLGLGTKLQFLPPPGSHERVWAAITALPSLRRLDLSRSQAVTAGHLHLLTALTGLQSLNLSGVPLPVSALAALQCLTAVTQLRIPNAKIVSERFMQLVGERRTVPRLAELITAMPQLRHLDLYWEGSGDSQSIMKDPKHMRTLARATQLRRLDIAKVAQVTDGSLRLLAPLTALTALKLGCNAWDLYPLTGRVFAMFRRWRALRIIHIEACRNLEKEAFAEIAASCPLLECLHLDTACRITPAVFQLATRMPSLSILELVDLALVADTEVRDVCGRMPELRPDMADHIIALKRCAGHNLAKFGEKIPGGFLGKMLA